MDQAGKAAFEYVQQAFGHLIHGLQQVNWETLPQHAQDYITNNPKMGACQIIMVIIAVVPGLVVAPALAALGFSSIGPVAGEN